MLTWTRNCVAILLLIAGVFNDVARVEGLKCYDCYNSCSVEKREEKDCTEYQPYCYEIRWWTTGDRERGCTTGIDYMNKGIKINDCGTVPVKTEICICDTDLCNNGFPPRLPKTTSPKPIYPNRTRNTNSRTSTSSNLMGTLTLICSLSAIATVTGHISLD